MPSALFKSAYLEIERSTEHIAEINALIRENPPFRYVLETNSQSGERSTLAEKNEPAIGRIQVLCGQAVHCLKTALDHAYWEIVSPLASNPGQEESIQFPFSRTADRLEEAAKNRLAHRVSAQFLQAILDLRPYREDGGNKMLYLINEIDSPRKHRGHTPVGDYTQITGDIIRRQVPDYPPGIEGGRFSQNRRDVVWTNKNFDRRDLVRVLPPSLCVFRKELDVPVDVLLVVGEDYYSGPIIPTLDQLVNVTKTTLEVLRSAI